MTMDRRAVPVTLFPLQVDRARCHRTGCSSLSALGALRSGRVLYFASAGRKASEGREHEGKPLSTAQVFLQTVTNIDQMARLSCHLWSLQTHGACLLVRAPHLLNVYVAVAEERLCIVGVAGTAVDRYVGRRVVHLGSCSGTLTWEGSERRFIHEGASRLCSQIPTLGSQPNCVTGVCPDA